MKINQIHNSILYKIVHLYLKANALRAQVHGPLTSHEHSELLYKAMEFRRANSISRAPYLYEDAQLEIEKELNIDERSFHFVVIKDGEMMGYIRLTPMPFEISSLMPRSIISLANYHHYFEFSRFITANHVTNKRYFALLLLLKAGHWLFAKKNAGGILGICKPNRLHYFKYFNLFPQNNEPVSITNRIGEYHFILGSKQDILFAISKMFIKKLNIYHKSGKNYELRTTKKHS